jgi:TRAP transporter TAXI family solute receptor
MQAGQKLASHMEDERMTGFITRREALALGAGLGALGFAGMPAHAQQRFFRIGTGGTGGTYYPVGGMIANAVSTDKINVSAVATNGSVANVNGIVGGSMESGFSQADINAWAYTGTGIYEGKPKIEELRVIANLYPESVHVVVKKGAGIKSLADLKGKRVSVDEPGSGTLVNARALLAAYGVAEKDIKPEYLKQVQSAEKFKDGSLDAYFQTTGYPQGTLSELAATNGFELLPIEGEARDKIMAQFKFFAKDKIPDGVYKDVKGVETVAVGAQWTTTSKQPDDLVYEITKALWSDKTRAAMDVGHAKGKEIQKATALQGVGIPLHAGAEKFYKEIGLLK